ncbi:MAG: SIMPL domain-containing protein [Pseudonocardia sp.]
MWARLSACAAMLAGVWVLSACSALGSPSGFSDSAAAPDANCAKDTGNASVTAAPGSGASAIVAHGTCRVVATGPDNITLAVVIQAPAPGARAALDRARGTANAVLAELARNGVVPQDIHSGALRVAPVVSPILTPTGVSGTRITGHEGTKSVTATLRDLTVADGVISAVVDALGDAGRIEVTYSVDDPALRAQARAAAVRQAQQKARQLAEAAGVPLGQLISITDVPRTRPAAPAPTGQPPAGTSAAAESAAGSAADDGRELDVSVDLVYAVG